MANGQFFGEGIINRFDGQLKRIDGVTSVDGFKCYGISVGSRYKIFVLCPLPGIGLVHSNRCLFGSGIRRIDGQGKRNQRVPALGVRDGSVVHAILRETGEQLIRVGLVIARCSRIGILGIVNRFDHLQGV